MTVRTVTFEADDGAQHLVTLYPDGQAQLAHREASWHTWSPPQYATWTPPVEPPRDTASPDRQHWVGRVEASAIDLAALDDAIHSLRMLDADPGTVDTISELADLRDRLMWVRDHAEVTS